MLRQKSWKWKKVFLILFAGPDGTYPYSGFFNCFAKSIANEGVTGLWVGLPTFYMRIAPHAMITVLVQDYLHDIFSRGKHWSN